MLWAFSGTYDFVEVVTGDSWNAWPDGILHRSMRIGGARKKDIQAEGRFVGIIVGLF